MVPLTLSLSLTLAVPRTLAAPPSTTIQAVPRTLAGQKLRRGLWAARPGVMRAGRELEDGQPDACRCAPCSCNRASSAPTPLLVVAIVALNYIPNAAWPVDEKCWSLVRVGRWRGGAPGHVPLRLPHDSPSATALQVIWSLELNDRSAGCVFAILLFHVLLSLLVLAWAHTCFTDPGVPPERWQRRMAALAAGGQEDLKVCRRSGLYKPARSHFCSVTRRLTLNMDHFCPWVVNTVGFYNRKFFLLFLFYACVTIAYSVLCIAAQARAHAHASNVLVHVQCTRSAHAVHTQCTRSAHAVHTQ